MGARLCSAEGSIEELLVPFAHYDDPDATCTAVHELPPGKL